MSWRETTGSWLLVAAAFITGILSDCVNKEEKWKSYKNCLQEFMTSTKNYNISSLDRKHAAWNTIICPANQKLHACYRTRILPCAPLVTRFNQDIKEKIRVKVIKANNTCLQKEYKPASDLDLGPGCEDYEERWKDILSCTFQFKELLNKKDKKKLCLEWSSTRSCHKAMADDCKPLQKIVDKHKKEIGSIYKVMEGMCPPLQELDRDNERKFKDLWKKRVAQREKEAKKGREGDKVESGGWWYWGQIALFTTLGLAPVTVVVVIAFWVLH